jgi:hypothetical protein
MVRWMKNKKQIKTTMKRTMLLVCMRESTNRTAERCGGLRRKKEKKEKIDRERRKKKENVSFALQRRISFLLSRSFLHRIKTGVAAGRCLSVYLVLHYSRFFPDTCFLS